jgi:hypothetical protein
VKKPGVAGFFISAIDPLLPIERAAANAKPSRRAVKGPKDGRLQLSVRIETEVLELLGPVRIGVPQALDVDAAG